MCCPFSAWDVPSWIRTVTLLLSQVDTNVLAKTTNRVDGISVVTYIRQHCKTRPSVWILPLKWGSFESVVRKYVNVGVEYCDLLLSTLDQRLQDFDVMLGDFTGALRVAVGRPFGGKRPQQKAHSVALSWKSLPVGEHYGLPSPASAWAWLLPCCLPCSEPMTLVHRMGNLVYREIS